MCRAATCKRCGKATWAGCGNHVDSVMAGVPQAQRCSCDPGVRNSREEGSKGAGRRRWSLFRS